MALSIKHAFQSTKADGADSTLVRPSNWNAEHTLTAAADRVLGRITPGSGAVEELTGTQATALLDTFTPTLKGLAPPSAGGTEKFLRADGNWVPPKGGVEIGDDPPSPPNSGMLWWESNTGNLYLYYDDGTSAQWVQVAGTTM